MKHGRPRRTKLVNRSACVIVSRTLTSLDPCLLSSASQLYELRLAEAVGAIMPVEIIALSGTAHETKGSLSLTPLGGTPVGLVTSLRLLAMLLRGKPQAGFIITFGYEPLMMLATWCARLRGLASYSMVFDSHKGAVASRPWLRRTLLDAYFATGFRMLTLLSGVFVVTEHARQIVSRFNSRVHLTRVGVPVTMGSPRIPPPISNEISLLYSGALESYNSIAEMMDACALLNLSDAADKTKYLLTICGSGSLRGLVEERAASNDYVKYLGRVPNDTVQRLLSKSHIALNLRDLNHQVSRFSFPSKTLELLCSGTPFITTAVIDPETLAEYGHVTSGIDPLTVSTSVKQVLLAYRTYTEKASRGRDFAHDHFDFNVVAEEMVMFMRSTSTRQNMDG